MPKVRTTLPVPTREKNQISLDLPNYLTRYIPQWGQPMWMQGQMWRYAVQAQPMAVACREALISMLANLDWRIESRDSDLRDEYKGDITFYTKFFSNNSDWDYTDLIEWIGKDLLDLPFGSAVEVGRDNNDPKGQIAWIEPLDGATLFPTLNNDYPVGQHISESNIESVYFPDFRINRVYMSPRTEIKLKGWGMPPPEKIYLALEALNRGDKYYANLLLDTPPAGLLDLVDMSEDSATKWLASWKDLLSGTDPFKIPVLYEHGTVAQFVSFTKSPTELMFDAAMMKYNQLCAAGYGISVSDVGMSESSRGSSSLAGAIRSERKTRKTGLSRIRNKFKYWFDRMLPDFLMWKYVDLDDEVSVAVGRARLADAQAAGIMIDKHIFTPEEMRQQHIADGLLTVPVPEKVPTNADWPVSPSPFGANKPVGNPKQNELVQSPVPVSAGGQGEVRGKANYSDALDMVTKSDPEFKDALEKIDEVWEKLPEVEQNNIVESLQDILDGIIVETNSNEE
jgi:hypothetical protein